MKFQRVNEDEVLFMGADAPEKAVSATTDWHAAKRKGKSRIFFSLGGARLRGQNWETLRSSPKADSLHNVKSVERLYPGI
jgi:hypothetical protein